MAKTSAELDDMITEVEQRFKQLRDDAEAFQAMRYMHKSYGDSLTKGMTPKITERVPLPGGHILDHGIWQTEGILNTSILYHVPARPDLAARSREQARVDRLELFWAWRWHRFNRGGELRRQTHSGQAGDPFVPWWLEARAFKLPEPEREEEDEAYEARTKQYREEFDPFTLMVKDYATVSFLPDVHGVPTLAILREDVPYVEVVKRYGKRKDRKPLQICHEEFPYLRGARGEPVDEPSLYNCKAAVKIVDDGVTICHTIDIKETKYKAASSSRYQMVDGETTKDYPNYFNRTSLFIVTGRYNHSAREMEDRYMPLTKTLKVAQQQLDVARTYKASITYTPKIPISQITDRDMLADVMAEGEMPDLDPQDAALKTAIGQVTALGVVELTPEAQKIEDALTAERDKMSPSPWLTVPDRTAAAYGTTGGSLAAIETSRQLYDNATESELGQMLAVSKAIEYYYCHSGAMGGSKKGAESQETIYAPLRGDEPSKQDAMRYIQDHGPMVELKPDDFQDDVIEITVTAATDAQKAERYNVAKTQAMDGFLPPDRVLETITQDVTGMKKELEANRRYQKQKPAWDRAALIAGINRVNLKGRVDIAALFQQFLLPGDPNDPNASQNGNGNGGSPPRPRQGMVVQQAGSPVTNPPAVGVQD